MSYWGFFPEIEPYDPGCLDVGHAGHLASDPLKAQATVNATNRFAS